MSNRGWGSFRVNSPENMLNSQLVEPQCKCDRFTESALERRYDQNVPAVSLSVTLVLEL